MICLALESEEAGLRIIELHKKACYYLIHNIYKIIEFCVIMETESKTQDYNGCPDKYITLEEKRLFDASNENTFFVKCGLER